MMELDPQDGLYEDIICEAFVTCLNLLVCHHLNCLLKEINIQACGKTIPYHLNLAVTFKIQAPHV